MYNGLSTQLVCSSKLPTKLMPAHLHLASLSRFCACPNAARCSFSSYVMALLVQAMIHTFVDCTPYIMLVCFIVMCQWSPCLLIEIFEQVINVTRHTSPCI
ncbi:unnamed protein product [Amaranthus hypochondriacus]